MDRLEYLLSEIRSCRQCEPVLPLGARPVLAASRQARILIAGQAPGRRVHVSGIPWDDASGKRLREWLGVTEAEFYNPDLFAIAPMGFCYPGSGASGDAPPRPECAAHWRAKLIEQLQDVRLTLAIGSYAQAWHLGDSRRRTLTETVAAWRDYWPAVMPIPHPSPRNNVWLKQNPWFPNNVLPALRERVRQLLDASPM